MEKVKKILIFSTAYYPFVGGAEVAIKEITDRIPNVQFDLITARLDSKVSKSTFDMPEKIGNVNVYRVGFGFQTLDKILLPFWGAIKTIKLNNKNQYDFYWCIMVSFGSGSAYFANILKFWKPVPIILNIQEGDSEEHFARRWFGLINLSWKMALKRTNKLTVLSNFLAERAKRFGYKGEIFLVPNGVDIDKFESCDITNELKEETRKKLGLNKQDLVLITTSRLVEKNGVGDVIKALKFLSTNVKFLILGDGELKPILINLSKNLDVSDRVIFKGFVSHSEIIKYLKSCDIFIRPSLSEGFGNSFIEAMACKLPVVATPVGGIPDFLVDGKTGYFCKPNDPENIAKVVNKVISDQNKNQITENAFKMVKEKYDWNVIAEIYKVFINK